MEEQTSLFDEEEKVFLSATAEALEKFNSDYDNVRNWLKMVRHFQGLDNFTIVSERHIDGYVELHILLNKTVEEKRK